jgi:hypothetical protein
MIKISKNPKTVLAGRPVAGRALVAAAVAGLMGMAAPAWSDVPDPVKGHVWAGCVLDVRLGGNQTNDTVADLKENIIAGSNGKITNANNIDVAFIVVYSVDNDNDGQPVSGGFTGPIICINKSKVGIGETLQTDEIPADGTEADTVDTLDAEDVFILRYVLNGGTNDGVKEKVICHTVNDQTDCFRISPLLLGGPG